MSHANAPISPAAPAPAVAAHWGVLLRILLFFAPLRGGLLCCVALPTALTILYQGILAADIYVSESAFSVKLANAQQRLDVGSIIPGLQYSSGAQEHLILNGYLRSRAVVGDLQKTVNLAAIYQSPDADPIARLRTGFTQEDLVEYFRRRVSVHYDEISRTTTLRVRAFSAKEAQQLDEAILTQAESFVNQISAKMHESAVTFAQAQLAKAEAERLATNEALRLFRNANKNFDPGRVTEGVGAALEAIAGKLIEKRTELEAAQGIMTEQNARVRRLRQEIAALQSQYDQLNRALVGSQNPELAAQLETYTRLELEHKFATKRYGLALAGLEAAQTEASRQAVYLARVVEPSLPDIATEPRRLYSIASVFFLTLAGYAMALLLAASIADHVRK